MKRLKMLCARELRFVKIVTRIAALMISTGVTFLMFSGLVEAISVSRKYYAIGGEWVLIIVIFYSVYMVVECAIEIILHE